MMHDFCVMPAHAALLALGGGIAYREKDSKASLYGGLGAAAVLAVCTGLSYQQFKEKKETHRTAGAVGLGVSAAVTATMLTSCKAITHNDKFAIAGAVLSVGFTAYYAWSLFGWPPKCPWACKKD